MTTQEVIARRIDQLIKKRGGGLTQKKIAQGIGISEQALSDYKRATREAEVGQLALIAKYFGVSLDYLVGKEECPTPDHQKIHERLGLSDAAIAFLESENAPGQRTAHSPGFAGVINELIVSEAGQGILRVLSYYFFDDFKNGYRAGNAIFDGDQVAQSLLLNVPSDLKQVRDGIRAKKWAEPSAAHTSDAPTDADGEGKEAPQ